MKKTELGRSRRSAEAGREKFVVIGIFYSFTIVWDNLINEIYYFQAELIIAADLNVPRRSWKGKKRYGGSGGPPLFSQMPVF